MPPSLYLWFIRLARGERLTKADTADYRLWLGVLFLFPIGLVTWGLIPKDPDSTADAWLKLTGFGTAACFVGWFWARWVSAIVSLILAVIAWSIFAWWYLDRFA